MEHLVATSISLLVKNPKKPGTTNRYLEIRIGTKVERESFHEIAAGTKALQNPQKVLCFQVTTPELRGSNPDIGNEIFRTYYL